MSAAPESGPAVKVARACPRVVGASGGWMAPRVVENVTTVPSWTGVPAASVTAAVTVVEPPWGRAVSATTRRTVDCVGARSGTDSHAAPAAAARRVTSTAVRRRAFVTGPAPRPPGRGDLHAAPRP